MNDDDHPTDHQVIGSLLSFLLRTLSFLLTKLTIRLIDPIALSHVSIKLELALNTYLFVGREVSRLTFMKLFTSSDGEDDRNKNGKEKNVITVLTQMKKTNNVIWLSKPAGAFTSMLSFLLYLKLHKQNTTEMEGHSNNNKHDYELAGTSCCTQ